jgi:hypothetical protein
MHSRMAVVIGDGASRSRNPGRAQQSMDRSASPHLTFYAWRMGLKESDEVTTMRMSRKDVEREGAGGGDSEVCACVEEFVGKST